MEPIGTMIAVFSMAAAPLLSSQSFTILQINKKYGVEKIPWSIGKAVLIEKFKTYHSVTPLNNGERILITLSYAEKPYVPSMLRPIEYMSNKAKNYGYIGIDAFTGYDVAVFLGFLLVIALSIRILLKKVKTEAPSRNTNIRKRVKKIL